MDFLSTFGGAISTAIVDLAKRDVPGSLLILSVGLNFILVYRYVRLAQKGTIE